MMVDRTLIKNLVFIASGIMFLLCTPLISEITGLPVYYIEPMRLVTIAGMIHFKKWSAFVMALVLPFISHIAFSHPPIDKAAIISVELLINFFLFFWFNKKLETVFLSMLLSIVSSKIICYTIYLLVYDQAFFESETSADFLLVQLLTTLVFSAYAQFVLQKTRIKTHQEKL